MDDEQQPIPTVGRAPIELLPTGILAVVGRFADGPMDTPVLLTNAADAAARFGPPLSDGDAALVLAAFFANGGRRAYAVRVSDEAAPTSDVLLGSSDEGRGLRALTAVADVDLVCLPDTARLGHEEAAAVVSAAEEACTAQRRMLLVDAPVEVADAGRLLEWIDTHGLRSRDAALYVPRLTVDDGGGNRRAIGTAGVVAGVYARTDRVRGVWKAPAGTEASLQGIAGLSRELGSREQGELNQRGVNVLRTLHGDRIVMWGARTLAGDGSDREWMYVPVRRTAMAIERALLAGLTWVGVEPNDAGLWRAVVVDVEDLLQRLWRQGAFPGVTPAEAFFVRCGLGATMTQADVDAGTVVLEVGLALVRPAEFVVVRLHLHAAGAAGATMPEPRRLADLGLSDGDLAVLRAAARRQVAVVGPTGTGRTSVARALAGELGAELFRVDLDEVVSRYIGETEKNLSRLFDRAEAAGAVLFFDEADALFGRRSATEEPDDRTDGPTEFLSTLRRMIAAHPGLVLVGVEDPEAASDDGTPAIMCE